MSEPIHLTIFFMIHKTAIFLFKKSDFSWYYMYKTHSNIQIHIQKHTHANTTWIHFYMINLNAIVKCLQCELCTFQSIDSLLSVIWSININKIVEFLLSILKSVSFFLPPLVDHFNDLKIANSHWWLYHFTFDSWLHGILVLLCFLIIFFWFLIIFSPSFFFIFGLICRVYITWKMSTIMM